MSMLLRRRGLLPKQLTVFNPLTQVTPLHAVWAEDPSWSHPADGGAVSSWRDQAGADPAQATGANQPLYRASVAGLGSKPAVEFDGVNDSLVFDIVDLAQTFKIVCVYKMLSLINNSRFIGTGGATTRGLGLNGTHSLYQMNFGTNLGFGTPDTNGHVIRFNAAGASTSIWIDEGTAITGNPNTGGITTWTLGSGELGNPANVQLHFMGIYSSSTTDASLAQLASDLKTHCAL